MDENMFCYQCQEAAHCVGCTQGGVCGKAPDVAAMQDLLVYVTKGLSAVTTRLRAQGAEGALTTWEEQKREEKGQKTVSDALDGVARSLPALIRAEKLQSKAAKAGFDWDSVDPVLDKLSEELEELRQVAHGRGDAEEELGDLLFAAVKAGRFLGADSEQALQNACEKFIRRFRRVEELAGGKLEGLPVSRLEELWAQAKKQEQQAT